MLLMLIAVEISVNFSEVCITPGVLAHASLDLDK